MYETTSILERSAENPVLVASAPPKRERPAAGRATNLARVVSINEDIKQVVHQAFAINLMALNAILAARSAGAAAAGFGIVAAEMRTLSLTLEQSMRNLRRLTEALLDATTRAARHARLRTVLRRVESSNASMRASLADVLQRNELGRGAFEREIAGHRKALSVDVDDAVRISRLGDSLAHMAKIEASWAAEHRSGLATVAEELALALRSILPLLNGLRHKLEDIEA